MRPAIDLKIDPLSGDAAYAATSGAARAKRTYPEPIRFRDGRFRN